MPIKKLLVVFSSVILALSLFFATSPSFTQADELEDINKQLAKLNDDLNKSVAATKPLESQLKSMQGQIENIKRQIPAIEADVIVQKRQIDNGYKKLADKEKLLSATIRDFYVKSYYDNPLLILFSLDNASDVTQALAYQRAKTRQDKAIITTSPSH